MENKAITLLAKAIVESCRQKRLYIAAAESFTGGLISSAIVSAAGASNIFLGGITAYSEKAKINLLKIPESTIKQHSAVSSVVAEEMARSALMLFGSDIAVSTTGYAGPDKGPGKTGHIFIGLAADDQCLSWEYKLKGSRAQIIQQGTLTALEKLNLSIKSK